MVVCCILILASIVLLVKSIKARQGLFFVLVAILTIGSSIFGEEQIRTDYKIANEIAALPNVTEKDLFCLFKTTETAICDAYMSLNSELPRQNSIAQWYFGLFFLTFVSFHVVFAIKYWTLSLKIDSLIKREENISLT